VKKHWWQSSEKVVIRVGALAAAIAAIIALVVYFLPKPDPVGRAAFLGIPLTPQPLSGYAASVTVTELPERKEHPNLIRPPAVFLEGRGIEAPLFGVTSTPLAHTDAAQTSMATTSPSPTETTSPSPTEISSPSPTEISTDPSREVPPGELPDAAPPPVVDADPQVVEEVLCAAVQDEVVASQFKIGGQCLKERSSPKVFEDQALDSGGDVVSPEIAAERFVAILERVRSVPYVPPPSAPEGAAREGLLDPLGLRATVNMEFEGLNGQTLLLYWRLSPTTPGAPTLPAPWLGKTLAWQFTPRTERGSGILDVWVPLPEDQGPYLLDFFVAVEDSFLTSYRTEPFG
jgi:hypothetical protein